MWCDFVPILAKCSTGARSLEYQGTCVVEASYSAAGKRSLTRIYVVSEQASV